MVIRYIKTFILVLTIGLLGPTKADYDQCKAVLDWIYRDLTLNNLELSYDRVMNKFLLGLHTVHDNTKNSKRYKSQMAKIFHRLEIIEPKLKPIFNTNKAIQKRSWWFNWRLKDEILKKSNLQEVIGEWKDLQKRSPELFKGLPENLKIDNWDTFTVDLLTKVSDYKFDNQNLRTSLKNLGKKFKTSTTSILKNKNFNPDELRKAINNTHKDMIKTLNKGYEGILNNYRDVCTMPEMEIVLENEKAFCPLPINDSITNLSLKLEELQKTILKAGLLNKDAPITGKIIGKNIDINLLNYKVSTHPKVTICKRKPELVSLIVIHHTQTKKKATPHDINRMHLNKSTDNDPWYMVGYNYMVSTTYKGATVMNPKVFQGRPPEIQGAHAGGRKFNLSENERSFFKTKVVSCGKPNTDNNGISVIDKEKINGGLKGNFHSFGVAIVGNYAPMSTVMIAGVSTPQNFIPEFQETASKETINTVAKLSCDLQNKYPRIKTIVPHSYFKSTDCPGNLIKELEKIQTAAKRLGCNFDIELKRKDGKWK